MTQRRVSLLLYPNPATFAGVVGVESVKQNLARECGRRIRSCESQNIAERNTAYRNRHRARVVGLNGIGSSSSDHRWSVIHRRAEIRNHRVAVSIAGPFHRCVAQRLIEVPVLRFSGEGYFAFAVEGHSSILHRVVRDRSCLDRALKVGAGNDGIPGVGFRVLVVERVNALQTGISRRGAEGDRTQQDQGSKQTGFHGVLQGAVLLGRFFTNNPL